MFRSAHSKNEAAAHDAAAARAAARGASVGELEEIGGGGSAARGGVAAAAHRARVVRRARAPRAGEGEGEGGEEGGGEDAEMSEGDGDAGGDGGGGDDGADDCAGAMEVDGGLPAEPAPPQADSTTAPGAPITQAWLAERKRGRWRELREARKRARGGRGMRGAGGGSGAPARALGADGGAGGAAGAAVSLEALARTSLSSAQRAPWQLIEMQPTSTPGVLKVWALVDGSSMHAIRVRVPRELFVNWRTAGPETARFTPASRVLPHGAVVKHMFRVRLLMRLRCPRLVAWTRERLLEARVLVRASCLHASALLLSLLRRAALRLSLPALHARQGSQRS